MADYRSMFDRKFVGAWDLGGKDVTVKIAKVKAETLRNRAGADKKPVVYFEGTSKGFALNKTNSKTIAAMYGNDTDAWIGKSITIYPSKTSFGNDEVDAIRVRPSVPDAKKKTETIANDVPVDEAMRAAQEEAAANAS
jgi:hypothetical protein